MSEVKRPEPQVEINSKGEYFKLYEVPEADAYMDELEAERDGWKRIADEMQGDYGEMEAERDLLRDNLKRIRDAVWETGVCGVLAKLEETE